MSQKEGKFQSKPRGGAGKFSGGGKSGGTGRKRPYSKSSEGDRPSRSYGDKPARGGKPAAFGDRKPRFDRDGGADKPFRERKPRSDRDGDSRGGKSFGSKPAFGDRKPRFDRDGDAPRGKSFGDRKPRGDFGDRKPRGDFGDRKPRFDRDGDAPRGKSFGDRKPRGDFGDRKPRSDFADRKPRGDFGDRKPRFDRDDRGGKPAFGDRKPRFDRDGDAPRGRSSFGDRDRKPRFDRDGDAPRGGFGDRKPRGGFGDRKPRGDFGDRKPRFDRDDRGGKSFGDRKPRFDRDEREERPAPKRKSGFEHGKSFKRYEDDRTPRVAASDDTRKKLKSERGGYGTPMPGFLFGVHAVTQALQNPARKHTRLLATESGFAAIEKVYNEARADGLTLPEPMTVEREDIDRLLPRDAVHQDILLDSEPLEEVFLTDITIKAEDNDVILVLDQVTDPHNVGAILRSAAAFGAKAVVVQKLHAPDITGTLAKSASGAVEHVPLVREVNLSRALEQLKDAGFFCIGLAERGESTLAGMKLSGKVALVLGAEGDGLRRLVAENCDALVRLPTQGEIGSLNVSNAAAVSLYELVRNRT